MNCAAYTTLCTVASVAHIANRLMHHVSHARGAEPLQLRKPHLRRTKLLRDEQHPLYVMPSAGASTRLTKLSAMPSSVYNSVASAYNFAQIHT